MYTIERLRYKLAPLEDREFTEHVEPLLRGIDLGDFKRRYKGDDYIVVTPLIIWDALFDEEPTLADLAKLGRSLQGLLWERSYLKGNLVFVKPLREYVRDGV